ncbi:hypothetical protein CSUB01_12043 [Colletotrichum sublineola]|uniref:Uncharacterized protein n=1 Tax=Colletotrichum sublineola TaxID=1173701 RepID=A0A066XUA6_COLSU|nr:hypothetical protein CSUB01_12043 [Colletotrichum sublineola]
MSVIIRVAGVLQMPYDPNEGFDGLKGGAPCINCLGQIHRDLDEFICCQADHVANCLACHINKKKCSAVPKELWGAAQSTWNHYMHLRRSVAEYQLSPLELWRIDQSLQRVAHAWTKIGEYIADPSRGVNPLQLQHITIQELASNREHMSLMIQVQAGIVTPDNVMDRLNQLQPAYVRDDSKAKGLRMLIEYLDGCWGKRFDKLVGEGELKRFPKWAEFRKKVNDYKDNPVPTCAIRIAGSAPIARGTGTETPQKKRKLAGAAANSAKRRRNKGKGKEVAVTVLSSDDDSDDDEHVDVPADNNSSPSGLALIAVQNQREKKKAAEKKREEEEAARKEAIRVRKEQEVAEKKRQNEEEAKKKKGEGEQVADPPAIPRAFREFCDLSKDHRDRVYAIRQKLAEQSSIQEHNARNPKAKRRVPRVKNADRAFVDKYDKDKEIARNIARDYELEWWSTGDEQSPANSEVEGDDDDDEGDGNGGGDAGDDDVEI